MVCRVSLPSSGLGPSDAYHLHSFSRDILKTWKILLLLLHFIQLPLLFLRGVAVGKVVAQVFHESVDKSFCWQAGICNLLRKLAITHRLFSIDLMRFYMSTNTSSGVRWSSYFTSFGGTVHKLMPHQTCKTSGWPSTYGSRFQPWLYNSVQAQQINPPSPERSNLQFMKYLRSKM